jgi:hypothetical protein
MKKSVLIAVLGVAASVATSYGQGYIKFSSYAQVTGYAPVTQFVGGALIGVPYTAMLYYAFGTVSDPVLGNINSITGLPSGFTLYTGQNSTAAFDASGAATGAAGLGYFDGGGTVIPLYTGGPITFEVVAFNGVDYASSDSRGRSGSFTMPSIRTDGVNSIFTTMPGFNVAVVPEPTTLALLICGIGGLGLVKKLVRQYNLGVSSGSGRK